MASPIKAPPTSLQELIKGLWRENPIFVIVIGLCPTMAITTTVINGLVMGAATTFVLAASSAMISGLRKAIPGPVRISVYVVIIATFVSVADWSLAAWLPEAHKQLGAFIALIVVNCIILGRAEAFAAKNPVVPSIADGIGMGLGFTLVLVMISAPREVLGAGTFLGIPLFGKSFEPWVIMVMPPGGFLTLAAELSLLAWWKDRSEKKKAALSAPLQEAV
jgi:electron transport complex protein RnfE